MTPRAAELMTLLSRRQQASSRNLEPTLIGAGLAVVGANIDSAQVVSLALVACVVIVTAHWFERRRWRRAHDAIARVSEGQGDAGAGPASRRPDVSE